MSKWTPKNSQIKHNTPVFYVDTRKFLKVIRGNEYRFVPKGGTSHTENIRQIFYHVMLMPLHDTMPSFMNFRRVLDLLEFKNKVSQCFVGNQRCPGIWNSFPFLALDLSMHPRTKIWFFNQFICIGARACSSNFNYAHKCIENSINA